MQKKLVAILVKPKILAWFTTGFPAAFDGLLTNENRKKRKLETLAKTQGKSGWKRKKPGSKLSAKSCKKSLRVEHSSTSLSSTWNLHMRLSTWADFPPHLRCPVMGLAFRRNIAKRGRSSVTLLVASVQSATLWRDDTDSRTCRTRSKGDSRVSKTSCGFRPWRLQFVAPSPAVTSVGTIPATFKTLIIWTRSCKLPVTCRKSSSGFLAVSSARLRLGKGVTATYLQTSRFGCLLWRSTEHHPPRLQNFWDWSRQASPSLASIVQRQVRATSAFPVGRVGTRRSRTSTINCTEKKCCFWSCSSRSFW